MGDETRTPRGAAWATWEGKKWAGLVGAALIAAGFAGLWSMTWLFHDSWGARSSDGNALMLLVFIVLTAIYTVPFFAAAAVSLRTAFEASRGFIIADGQIIFGSMRPTLVNTKSALGKEITQLKELRTTGPTFTHVLRESEVVIRCTIARSSTAATVDSLTAWTDERRTDLITRIGDVWIAADGIAQKSDSANALKLIGSLLGQSPSRVKIVFVEPFWRTGGSRSFGRAFLLVPIGALFGWIGGNMFLGTAGLIGGLLSGSIISYTISRRRWMTKIEPEPASFPNGDLGEQIRVLANNFGWTIERGDQPPKTLDDWSRSSLPSLPPAISELSLEDMIAEIGSLERRAQFVEAAALCKHVLELPQAAEYHEYAKNMIGELKELADNQDRRAAVRSGR